METDGHFYEPKLFNQIAPMEMVEKILNLIESLTFNHIAPMEMEEQAWIKIMVIVIFHHSRDIPLS